MTGGGAWPPEDAAATYGPLLGVLLLALSRQDPRPLLRIIDLLEAEGNALDLEVVADRISAEAHDEFLDTEALTVLVQLAVQLYGRASAIAPPDRRLFLAAKGLGISSLLKTLVRWRTVARVDSIGSWCAGAPSARREGRRRRAARPDRR